jgi:MoxR-like ATPase
VNDGPAFADLSLADVVAGLGAQGYLPDDGLATAVLLAMRMQRPLLLEGEPGTGKTELARAISAWTGGELIRLQCYEGLDASQSLFEWDHARQLLHLRTAEAVGAISSVESLEGELHSERFLIRRPLLQAISHPGPTPPVLLIDELDRADDEFEAFLLEVLAESSVTVPELGTFTAVVPPIVIITSNRTRDLHDALKRRCLYHWVEHPDLDREIAIVQSRVPDASAVLARQVAALTASLRTLGLHKPPGVAETIDWLRAMAVLDQTELDPDAVSASLGAVVKYREDAERVRSAGLGELVAEARAR